MSDSVKYFRWDVPVEIESSALKELAEEISTEKRMPVEDVEQGLVQLIQVKKNQIKQRNHNWQRTKVRLQGGYGWNGGIF